LIEVPENWMSIDVGSMMAMLPGFAFKSENFVTDTNDGLPLIRIRDLGETTTAARYVGEYDAAFAVQDGDILVGMDGEFSAVRWQGGKALLNQRVLKLSSAREDVLDDGFLFYRLQPALQELEQSITGTTVKHLSTKELKRLVWHIPPLDEQRRIAEALRSVDEAITAQSNVCLGLRTTTENLADELYAREIEVGQDCMTEYGQACETVQVGIVIKPASYYVNDSGVPALRSTNIKRNEIDFSQLVQLSHEGHEINRKSALRVGDVVTIRTGEPGKTAVIPDDAPSALNCIDIIFSRPKPTLRSRFAAFFINSSTARTQIAAMQGGLAQQHFNVGEMKRLRIPIPSLERQDRIVELLEAAWQAVRAEEAQLRSLQVVKAVLLSDLLSGRVRTSTPAVVTGKTVPPAFKRAVFAAEIVHQLHADNRFGSVKHEKIVHLCELHLHLQTDLGRHAYKEAAGPYDPKARRSVEGIFQQQKWFEVTRVDGKRVVYVPLDRIGGHAAYFDRYFGDQKEAVQSIIDLLRPLSTEQCEIVATLYSVWNDYLIDKLHPTDDEIVSSVLQWHPKKQEIAEDRWRAALPWMRQKGLVPKGVGEKTRVAQP